MGGVRGRAGDERRKHGGRRKSNNVMRCNRGRSDKRYGDQGREHSLIGCGRLRVFDKRMSSERFSDRWGNNDLVGYNGVRGLKNRRRSNEGRLGSNGINDNLTGCNGLGGGSSERRLTNPWGENGGVVPNEPKRLGGQKYFLGRDKLRRFGCL